MVRGQLSRASPELLFGTTLRDNSRVSKLQIRPCPSTADYKEIRNYNNEKGDCRMLFPRSGIVAVTSERRHQMPDMLNLMNIAC